MLYSYSFDQNRVVTGQEIWSDLYSESGKIDIWERSRKIEISTVSIYLYQRMNENFQVTVIFESMINKQCELSVQGRGQRVLGCP